LAGKGEHDASLTGLAGGDYQKPGIFPVGTPLQLAGQLPEFSIAGA
jgi:hypothetical protein